MTCLLLDTSILSISTLFRIKGFWVLQLSTDNRQERTSEQIMNLLSSKTAYFKARSIALASAVKINANGVYGFMVFNVTYFNNISAVSWRSVLLVEETGVPGENHRPVASH